MSQPDLVYLSYSPWSLMARWALAHQEVDYRGIRHTPMLGEIPLRRRLGRWSGKVTVPVLFCDDGTIESTRDIARWADRQSSGPPLIEGLKGEVDPWFVRADAILDAGRARVLERMLHSPRALGEAAPGPQVLWPLLAPVGYLGTLYMKKKYLRDGDEASHRASIRVHLQLLHETLRRGPYLVAERLTFADVAMACAIGAIQPAGRRIDGMSDAYRQCWVDEALCAEYPGVIAWRDEIFATHYPERLRRR